MNWSYLKKQEEIKLEEIVLDKIKKDRISSREIFIFFYKTKNFFSNILIPSLKNNLKGIRFRSLKIISIL